MNHKFFPFMLAFLLLLVWGKFILEGLIIINNQFNQGDYKYKVYLTNEEYTFCKEIIDGIPSNCYEGVVISEFKYYKINKESFNSMVFVLLISIGNVLFLYVIEGIIGSGSSDYQP